MLRFVVFATLFALPSICGTLIVIRHGQSLSNTRNINCANPARSIEFPLTDLGIQQVKSAARKFAAENLDLIGNIRFVYVSPVRRAQQTAEVFVDYLGISRDLLLTDYTITESGYGDNEGKDADHVRNKDPDFAKAHFAETETEVSQRILAFVNRVRKVHTDDTILVVTHGSPMMEILNHVEDPKTKHEMPANAEIRVLELTASK